MRKSILKMEDSVKSNIEIPKYPHSAIICGQTNSGKTVFVLDLLAQEYQGMFENIVTLCPTIGWNKDYKNRSWIGDVRRPKMKNITIVKPVLPDGTEKLQELLRLFFDRFAGSPTLYIIDDCSATKELTKKKDMPSQLAFSGRHAEQSVWVISEIYNSVLKQATWVWLSLVMSMMVSFRAVLFPTRCLG